MRRLTRSGRRVRAGCRGDPLAAVDGVFVGRDDLFYQLETAARLQQVVVLTGPGGQARPSWRKGLPGGGATPAAWMTRGWCSGIPSSQASPTSA